MIQYLNANKDFFPIFELARHFMDNVKLFLANNTPICLTSEQEKEFEKDQNVSTGVETNVGEN